MNLVSIDIETTGLNPDYCQIIEYRSEVNPEKKCLIRDYLQQD
jgi:oligoribonuclease (3'-5' exoribonuclease)